MVDITTKLSDKTAERVVLGTILNWGQDAFFEVADLLNVDDFVVGYNQYLYRCVEYIFEDNGLDYRKIDLPTLSTTINAIGFNSFLTSQDAIQHIHTIMHSGTTVEAVREIAQRIARFSIARRLYNKQEECQQEILNLTGNESGAHIVGIVENAMSEFIESLTHIDAEPQHLKDHVEKRIQELAENPVEQIGISTGFDRYDKAIGGGLRESSLNVIAARMKVGKTIILDNMAHNICEQGIPVLNIDTEMTFDEHIDRLVAMESGIPTESIETGKFALSADAKEKINKAVEKYKQVDYTHKWVGDIPFEDQLAIMRRWIVKNVGLNNKGEAKRPCVIFYDYIKWVAMNEVNKNMSETQLLGFKTSTLKNFASRYKIPIVAFAQTNRDGINNETTSVLSGSDRVLMYCSNGFLFKAKTDEEIAQDGVHNGTRKMVPLVIRHSGGSMSSNDYINYDFKGHIAKIVERPTKMELEQGINNEGTGEFHADITPGVEGAFNDNGEQQPFSEFTKFEGNEDY
jgi:replicative DNA helicase